MSYLLDIFNRRQPMPEVSGPQQMPTPMAMPSGGPNVGQPMPAPDPTANAALCGTGWSGGQYQPGTALLPQSPGIGGVSQMPAFQLPQPMPFNNRPMPQFGAPNFSLQGGMTAAPQPSPMNGMMKGMFGVR